MTVVHLPVPLKSLGGAAVIQGGESARPWDLMQHALCRELEC